MREAIKKKHDEIIKLCGSESDNVPDQIAKVFNELIALHPTDEEVKEMLEDIDNAIAECNFELMGL